MCHREAPPSMGYVKGGDRNRVAFDGLAECSGAGVTKHMPEGRATEKRAVSRREGVDHCVSLFVFNIQIFHGSRVPVLCVAECRVLSLSVANANWPL